MSGENSFWDILQSKMGCIVPKYLVNLLLMRGYDSAFSVRRMTIADINGLSLYAKSDEMKESLPPNAKLENYYCVFSSKPDKFDILPGHVNLLLEIVDFIKLTMLTKGTDYFSGKHKASYQGNLKMNQ